ncbi:nucleotidyltransferase domain-containing protein [Kribbella sp. NPDC058245]|uniref:nucleotidyltransferase domain-containing protein n=1 Tax=Kribbella sp. NPDC058245 TaxID=3346399 RepID=UPI0036EDEAD4
MDPVAALREAIIAVTDDDVQAVLLFGSIARGEGTPDSDIDLAVIAPSGWNNRVELEDNVRRRHPASLRTQRPSAKRGALDRQPEPQPPMRSEARGVRVAEPPQRGERSEAAQMTKATWRESEGFRTRRPSTSWSLGDSNP